MEAQVLTHPGVSACAVVGHPDEHFGQRIVAYVVLKAAGVTPDDLKVHLKEHCQMSGYKVPKAIHILDALPTGLTGKLDRRALRNAGD
ncbi:AMP-binding enzyme [Variovorax sp. Varisp62]|uniref:AMP-binding enzyme n=1 Tax=Variovorax sp. Varisp62 TaxID=3243049 RepID=UPI0039B36C1A